VFSTRLTQKYYPELDATLRNIVNTLPVDEPGFGVMLRYTMGWVDQDDQPIQHLAGKRIRPILLLLCAEAAGGRWQDALPAAAAVELLHNFSLIHDDIQDDSLTRHGLPTVWKVWGRANAINAGDALFTLSYCALESLSNSNLTSDLLIKVWRIFNATMLELTRGQHLDMRFEHQETVTVDEYISMIKGKSAALIAACAQIGALIATQSETLAAHYADFGLNLGIAFQIRDDILGIWGDPTVTGKSAATDIISRKKSLPVLYGLSRLPELIDIYKREPFIEADVAAAVRVLDSIDTRSYTQDSETQYYRRAMAALESANPQGEAADGLLTLVNALLERQY
jgi:geranylgeranyl diphosphate synthase, type I